MLFGVKKGISVFLLIFVDVSKIIDDYRRLSIIIERTLLALITDNNIEISLYYRVPPSWPDTVVRGQSTSQCQSKQIGDHIEEYFVDQINLSPFL